MFIIVQNKKTFKDVMSVSLYPYYWSQTAIRIYSIEKGLATFLKLFVFGPKKEKSNNNKDTNIIYKSI